MKGSVSMNSPFMPIEKLLTLKSVSPIKCYDEKEESDKPVYGIGNTYIPDHKLICIIPRKLRSEFGYGDVTIKIHIIWLKADTASGFEGLVVDKFDNKVYYAKITVDEYSSGHCKFLAFSDESISVLAKAYNPFINTILKLSSTDPKKLLDFQIYSPFRDRFIYIELALDDRIALCGIGLHSNALLQVGWLGKLINKDLWISYAECGFKEYEQIKSQNNIYERARLMEKHKSLFINYNTLFENRRRYDDLLDVIEKSITEPLSQRNAAVFIASQNATTIKPYAGPASPWMEMAITQCQKDFGLIK